MEDGQNMLNPEDPVSCTDLWPISILPILSKVYGRIIMTQLCSFIGEQSLYSSNQSGSKKHCTNTLLIKLRGDNLNAFDKGEFIIA